ncbi:MULTISPECIES: MFS transporter [unclassified Actinomyces]|uniref:MFS transporter n=1 Tax=unclassified Actinomyces TaxID=2609248 RepID=UPI00137442BA|nr:MULTISPECIES: MFS transporter [unclassified Actinomyces]MBW3069766.1 MFS transporter [Actinomyces sp. 594]NDR54121.1 MFS transporter [Actinomyces sp. 565]QHO92062.1 MFS transporter [Actinomyces sp. 432]
MAQQPAHATENDTSTPSNLAPDTGLPLPRSAMVRFGIGFLCISLLWATGLNTIAAVLLPQRLKDIGVDNPTALLGTISAVTAIVSLFSNLIFGNLSDRTRSRFGKRSPWVISGGVLGGLCLFAIGILTNAGLITLVYCVCMVGLNMMLAPAVAVLSDRVPETIRGTMSTFWGVGASIGYPIGAIVGARFISESGAAVSGFTLGGILMGIAGIFAVLVWPRERSSVNEASDAGTLKDLLVSFIPPIHGAADFWKAFIGRFTMLVSYQMINAYQLYIIQDYLGLSTTQSAATVTLMSTITLVVGLIGGFIGGPLSDLLHRRKVPVVMASLCFALGVAMPWIMPTTTGIYLFAFIAGFGYSVYSSVDQALNVDVLPNPETAGKDLGILNVSTTLGQMSGPVITSAIVTATGAYTLVFPVSIACAVVGCFSILAIRSVR